MESLNNRFRDILTTVILYHIRLGAPIGSRTVTKLSGVGLSPATIRNVMADLEELGYLAHPYTSAGRVPTEKGYRYYVDSLLQEPLELRPATERVPTHWWPELSDNPAELLHEASRLLSEMSHYAGVAMAPRPSQQIFKQIQFIGLRSRQVLAIFVSEDGLVHQTPFEMDREFSTAELSEMAHHLNSRFSGMPLQTVKRQIVREMQEVKERYDSLLRRALELGRQAMDTPDESEVYVEGATNILDQPEFADLEEMKQLFRAFDEKYRILNVLQQCMETPGVHVYIGSENAVLGTSTCSMVVSTYEREGQPIGSVGVIGPTRMDYSSVIPLVQETATQLSHIFDEWKDGASR